MGFPSTATAHRLRSTARSSPSARRASSATRGAVYVYERQAIFWVLQAKLTAPDAAIGDFFGTSVALNNGRLIVGASGKDSSKGAAYIFVRYGTNWLQTARLNAIERQNNSNFGSTVSLEGGVALVGSWCRRSRGSAQLFARYGTNWVQRARIKAADGLDGDRFGYAVSLSGDRAVAGAPSSAGTGAGYLFNLCSHTTLVASDELPGDVFGQSISAGRNAVLVGVPGGATNKGAACLFGQQEIHGRNWRNSPTQTDSPAISSAHPSRSKKTPWLSARRARLRTAARSTRM